MPNRALEAALSRPVPEAKAELFRALAHPARVRVLEVLSDGEHSVGQCSRSSASRRRTSHSSWRDPAPRAGDHAQGGLDRLLLVRAAPELAELLAVAKRFMIVSLSESTELLAGLKAAGAS